MRSDAPSALGEGAVHSTVLSQKFVGSVCVSGVSRAGEDTRRGTTVASGWEA